MSLSEMLKRIPGPSKHSINPNYGVDMGGADLICLSFRTTSRALPTCVAAALVD